MSIGYFVVPNDQQQLRNIAHEMSGRGLNEDSIINIETLSGIGVKVWYGTDRNKEVDIFTRITTPTSAGVASLSMESIGGPGSATLNDGTKATTEDGINWSLDPAERTALNVEVGEMSQEEAGKVADEIIADTVIANGSTKVTESEIYGSQPSTTKSFPKKR
jgi:hypothetical protein